MSHAHEISARIRQTLSGITGHQPQDLEADLFLEGDLGIDSIKMVDLVQTLLQLIPEARREAFLIEVPNERLMQVQTIGELEALLGPWSSEGSGGSNPSLSAVAAVSTSPAATTVVVAAAIATPTAQSQAEALAPRLFALISGITGHRASDLDLEMYLEGDLGIDSIKMVELSQSLLSLLPESQRERFIASVPNEQLMQLHSLRELHDLLAPWCAGAPAVAVVADAGIAAVTVIASQLPVVPTTQGVAEAEMLHSQIPFLVSHWAVSTCSLCSRVRLQGRFDLNHAQAAWTDLLLRHPALRGRFHIPAGATAFKDYRFEILPPTTAPRIELRDQRHLNGAQQDAAIADELARSVNHEWPLEAWPLHRFSAWQLADEVFEVFFANHHLVSDGLSNQLIVREFLALYEAHATGRVADLPPVTTLDEYRSVVTSINAWASADEDRALAEFMRAQGKQGFYWNPNSATRSTQRAQVRNHRFRLDESSTQALQSHTRALRVSMNSLLVGAYLRTVASFGNAPEQMFVNVPTSGRVYPGVDAASIVGCFAQNLTLGFAAPQANEDWAPLLTRVHAEIERHIGSGVDRAQNRQTALFAREKLKLENGRIPAATTGMIRAGMKSNLYLPYIGQTHIARQYAGLNVLDYQAATVTNAGTLDTVIELHHGGLEMTTNYDAGAYDAAFVAQVGEAFLAQLHALAAWKPALTAKAQANDAPREGLLAAQLRQVASEVMHRRIADGDFALDLEADLGLDSLERIRIVSRLEHFQPGAQREALLACRSLDEMLIALGGTVPAALAAPAASAVSTAIELAALPYLKIAEQCRHMPNALAVLSDEGSLTYAELHAQSNRLAHFLRAQGVGRGSLVGLMLNRGPRFMVSLLAVLKAGGAYVPLDPDYPAARLQYMLEHARIGVLVTEQAVQNVLLQCLTPELPLRTRVFVDEAPAASGAQQTFGRTDWLRASDAELAPVSQPDDPMVVLYTSGSTGRPKGVVLAHRGYANRFDWHQQLFRLIAGERVAQKTSICFDISVWELLWPLLQGGTVCPVQTSVLRDPVALAQWVTRNNIHVMHFVPSLFGEFLHAIEQQGADFPALRQLIFSGEALPVAFVRRWMSRYGTRITLTNLYGPTEASIDVTAHTVTEIPRAEAPRIPIGRAMPGVQLRVLDDQMHPLPPGTPGELWIGGVQLAQGYLHDAERTAEAFKPNPFREIPGALLYRTGDLVVEQPDGAFDYRGRLDSQVKIRGYRVELGEIEAVLGAHDDVREAAALAIDFGDGHPRLVAWVVGNEQAPRVLREHLSAHLPHYMIPHRFEWLPSLPKNPNGKIDRKALRALVQNEAGTHPALESSALARAIEPALHLPVGPAQHWLLSYFPHPHRWAGYTRFGYRQTLDFDCFNRALALLRQRHPALRSAFYRKDGAWHQHFAESGPVPQAELYDGRSLSASDRSAWLRSETTQRLNALELENGQALWGVIVLQSAETQYEISVWGHHIVSDMLGNGLLFKDLWRLYAELLAGNDPAQEKAPRSFVDYLAELQRERTPEAQARHVDWWTSRFGSHAPFRLPNDHHLGDNVESSSTSEHFTLSAEDSTALQRLRQRWSCNLYPLLLAPLHRLLAEWGASERVVLSHRTHGRDLGDGRTYFDAVGNFAINHPTAVQVQSVRGWEALVRDIASSLDEAPLKGASYDLVGDRLPRHLYPDAQLTPVRANYLGQRSLPQSGLFAFDEADWDQRYAEPQQKRSSQIEVFFRSVDGRLQVEISYSKNLHRAETIRRWGERFVALTRELSAQAVATPAMPAVPANVPLQLAAALPRAVTATPMSAQAQAFAPSPRALEGKVAIVTGAGRGIGLCIAETLARQGARIALVSRSAGPLQEALHKLREITPEVIAITADVTRQEEVENMVQQAVSRFGGIDILVNNAGANQSALLAESDPEEWRRLVEINLMSPYLCSRFVLPHMLERGSGKIVNLSSVAGVIGYPLFSAYCAAKHGILGLTKALAEEVKQRGIQVNAVCPAFVDTRMTPQAFRNSSMPPEQVAEVVLFLASPASAGITGETLNIFGKQDMYAFGSEKLNAVKAMTRGFSPGVDPGAAPEAGKTQWA